MRRTLALAEEAISQGEFPIAAVIVLDDAVIAEAYTCENRERRLLVHGELTALLEADKRCLPVPDRRRAVLYTNLEPCLMCLGAAMSFYLGGIVYGLESPSDGAVGLVREWERRSEDFPSYQMPSVTGGVLRDESITLVKKYVSVSPPGPMRDWAETLARL